MFNTPVALIIFRRPALTEQVLQALAKVRPQQLFVIADGPRADVPTDPELCAATRSLIERIDWPCEIATNYADANLGCGKRPATGISWVFEQVDRAIILEDDCVPHPSFFRFCEEMLTRYADDERVMHIGGSTYQRGELPTPYSYFFSCFNGAWGWATWRRAWRHFDIAVPTWPLLRDTSWLMDLAENETAAAMWAKEFEVAYQRRGDVHYWDHQWTFACWANSGLSVRPKRNLVSNIGCIPDATHTFSPHDVRANLPALEMPFPLNHPPHVLADRALDRKFLKEIILSEHPEPASGWQRVRRRLVGYTPSPIKKIVRKLQEPDRDLAQTAAKVAQRAADKTIRLGLNVLYRPRGIARITTHPDADSAADEVRVAHLEDGAKVRVFRLHGARLHTNRGGSIAAINRQNQLVEGASWQYVNRTYGEPEHNSIFSEGILSRPKSYSATVCSLLSGGGANDNYSHWLCDVLSRLHLIKQTGLYDGIDYFVVPAFSFPFQIETFECLGIRPDQVISSMDLTHIAARELIITDHPRPGFDDDHCEIPGWICHYLRNEFLKHQKTVPGISSQVYISRQDSFKRQINNEPELIEALSRQGFSVVALTDYTFAEQVGIFANARAIVSTHGAALTNLVFCPLGARVIEFFNESYEFRCFQSIARHTDLEYHALVSPDRDSADKHPNLRNIDVDVAAVLDLLAAAEERAGSTLIA